MLNALTVDVEDCWSIFSRDWLSMNLDPTEAVVRDTENILELLSDKNTKATFFVLGNVAAKFPSLVKRIAAEGHELGIHGFSHTQIFKLTPDEFRLEVKKAKNVIEDLTSVAVVGHRAAAFSVNPGTKWALRVLAQEGFKYDSSIVPCKNPRYGWEGFSKDICRIDLGEGLSIVEVPMSILPLPMTSRGFMTGGGYLRLFPYSVSHKVVSRIQKTRPVIVYVHPYEFSKEKIPMLVKCRTVASFWRANWRFQVRLRNRHTVPVKIRKLLSAFEFGTLKCVIDQRLGRS